MSTTTAKKRAPARKPAKRKTQRNYDQLTQKAEQDLDRAFKKLMQFNGSLNDAQMIKHLEHVQQLLEEETGGQAFVLVPDLPIPASIVERVLREQPRTMNASEALFGFMGWLTTRAKPIILSKQHTDSAAAVLVSHFITENGLAPLRADWEKGVKSMADVATDLTNDPALSPCQFAPPPPTFDEAYTQIRRLFYFFHDQRQNHLLARLIQELSDTRLAEFHDLTDNIKHRTERHTQLADAAKELDQVLSGNFTIVQI